MPVLSAVEVNAEKTKSTKQKYFNRDKADKDRIRQRQKAFFGLKPQSL
jgi:hypothetical protein